MGNRVEASDVNVTAQRIDCRVDRTIARINQAETDLYTVTDSVNAAGKRAFFRVRLQQ